MLQALEQAEAEEDPSRHRDLLTFILVGAGPTGVEMAGAIAFLVRSALKSEFRRIDPTLARIVLVDMANRVLGSFSQELSEEAKQYLESLGVEVRLGQSVDQIDADGISASRAKLSSGQRAWLPQRQADGCRRRRIARVGCKSGSTLP
jgi:NADH dehydrogenase FAD-containing subunit